MIKKRETCLYCGEKMESKTAKKKFCSPIHKLYWHREKERGTLAPSQLELEIKSATIAKENGVVTAKIDIKVPEGGEKWFDERSLKMYQEFESEKTKEIVESIEKEILEIEKEVIPKERDTTLGRKIWRSEQFKKIDALKTKIKILNQQ